MAVQIKFKIQQACMQQNAFRISYYRDHQAWILSGNSEPQPVCLCCLSVDITGIFRFAFLIILCIYISSSVCAVLMLMISPNSLLPTEKKIHSLKGIQIDIRKY